MNRPLIACFSDARDALARHLAMRGASSEEIEDILQDIYVKLLTDSIGPVAQPRAYLYTMVTNHFLVSRRAVGRRRRREDDWVWTHAGGAGALGQGPSIEAELIAREQLALIEHALDELPERSRAIFRRFRIDGERRRLIAEDFDISVSAVEKHLARAYSAVAKAKCGDGEG